MTNTTDTLTGGFPKNCSVCDIEFYLVPEGKPAHVDHRPDSDEVRGVRCDDCYTAMSLFDDNPRLLREASLYLEADTGS